MVSNSQTFTSFVLSGKQAPQVLGWYPTFHLPL